MSVTYGYLTRGWEPSGRFVIYLSGVLPRFAL